MSTPIELQPDTEEVLQAEAPEALSVIPTRVTEVQAPVRVQQLPRKSASSMTKLLTTSPQRILTADHRRGRALLVAEAPFLVAFSETSCQAVSSMAFWPANIPLELTATTEVWAICETETEPLAVITERWADGP